MKRAAIAKGTTGAPMTILGALLVAVLGAGCERAPDGTAVALDAQGSPAASEPATPAPLLERISEAPSSVPFHGRRRVRQAYDVLGVTREVEYFERVASDGAGGFAVELEDVLAPTMSPREEDLFKILQDSRQGFLYENRDFRIRALEAFRDAYAVVKIGSGVEVAGHACVELEVRRHVDSRRYYVVAVHPGTGLVLRSEERAPDGRLLSSSAFESLEIGAPPEETAMYRAPFERRPVDPDLPALEQVGFELLQPTLVPEGYRLEKIDALTVDDELSGAPRTWVRFVYEDGVERLYFLHSPEPAAQPAGNSTGLAQDVPVDSFEGDTMTLAAVGPWNVLDGSVRGQGLVALGKVGEDALLQLVQSALEGASSAR